MADGVSESWTEQPGALRRFWISALVLAPLAFGPNMALAALGDSPLVSVPVAAGNALVCGVAAIAYFRRGFREPAARTSWFLATLSLTAMSLAPLNQLITASAYLPRPGYPSTGDLISLFALPLGAASLLCLPIRPAVARKGLHLALDSLLFATSSLFIAFTLAYSRHVRLEFALPAFRDGTLLELSLVIADLAVILYVARTEPACLRGPVGFIAAAIAVVGIPSLLAIRLVVPEFAQEPAHPIFLCYSGTNYALCLAALWPRPVVPAPRPGRRVINPDLVLTSVAYAPAAVTTLLGFWVISGNRPLMWSGFACIFLVVTRLVVALLDSRGLSVALRERVRERTEQLAESQARLARAERLDALGRLAGGVAHDFNNLLTAVIGNAQLLESSLPAQDRRQAFVGEITRACQRAGALTRQLLTFARKQPKSLQVFSPSALVKDMQGLLQRTITESVRLTVCHDPGTGNVKMDPYQLEQVVLNLAVNARDAMPEGGSLLIDVSNVFVNSDHASLHPNATVGPHVRLRVRDSGTGIPREVVDRIFDPFFTTKKHGKGTGLGLAICYGIVKEAEGHLVVESQVGRGTTFDVYLRVSHEAVDPPSAVAPIAPSKCKGTILLAEDEPAVRRLMVEVLRSAGYETLVAENGAEATRVAGAHDGRIELFLTDLVMPEMSGLDAAEQVTSSHPEARVLVMSGYTADEAASQRLQSKQIPFLLKPVTPAALLIRIQELITA
jgi:signal transduction histidine kinase/CheY-like chemotaxis protein